jgi:transposase
MTRPKATPVIDLDRKALEELLERAKAVLLPSDFALVKGMAESLATLTELVRKRGTTIARLRHLFGLSGSEKLADVVGNGDPPKPPPETSIAPAGDGDVRPAGDDEKSAGVVTGSGEASAVQGEKKKVKGHGRVPASAYLAASHIPVPHASLAPGHRCLDDGCSGKVYRLQEPAPFVRIFGQAPLSAIVWDCARWRCGACGKVYTARAPEQAQGPKYDETASSMMAVLHYGTGMPFHRMGQLQRRLETPIPASTQWDVVKERVEMARPAYDALVRLAAQGSVVHNDDSYMRVLSFMGKRRAALLKDGRLPDPERTGLFTTAIVSIAETRPAIALFFTGRKHAGENLGDVLDKRDENLPPPVQMGDALTRNLPEQHAVVASNCIAHGRRKIVDEIGNYPAECRDVLEKLSRVYKVDDLCREKRLSPEERLGEHQRESGPFMAEIRRSMEEQIAKKQVEPNSGIGEAYHYFLKRWDKFTLFLRVPGAPLDNNICERALKMAIKHRNASLFYRSQRGATVGDIYMTLIHTTELAGENPFDYLTELQRNAKNVADKPADWLPWNYRDTLAQRGTSSRPPATTRSRAPPTVLTQPGVA